MHKAALSSIESLDAQNDDELSSGMQVFQDLLNQSLKNNLRITHVEQEADFCRVRSRLRGRLTEYRVDSGDVVVELLAEFNKKADSNPHPSTTSFTFDIRHNNVLCHVECNTYPTANGSALTIQISHDRNIPDTLDQTTLPAESISKLRAHTSQQHNGITVVSSPSTELMCETYYALLSEQQNLETRLVSIESSKRKLIPRVSHTTITDSAELVTLDADHIFIDWRRGSEPQLLNELLNAYPNATLLVKAKDAATAARQLTDIAISERQLATNLTTIIELDHAHMICPHCAEAHNPNGTEIKMMENHRIKANSVLNYAPGCDRCDHTGLGEHRTLMSLCEVNDMLRQAIETRCTSEVTKRLQSMLGKKSLVEQRKHLVSAGQMELRSLR